MKTNSSIKYTTIIYSLLFFFVNIYATVAQDKSEEAVYTIVENMPASKSCMNIIEEMEKRKCTSESITNYIRKNISYPTDARNAGIEGIVYVSYIVNKEGYVEEVEVLRGIEDHESLDKEAVRVVKTLPQFTPGTQREKKVNVRYNVPIKFTL